VSLATRRVFATTLLQTHRHFAKGAAAFRAVQERRANIGGRWTHSPASGIARAFPWNSSNLLTHAPPTVMWHAGDESGKPALDTFLPRLTPSLTFAKVPNVGATGPLPATESATVPSVRADAQHLPALLDVARLSEEVYRHIQRKIRIDRERRGISG
jgi:hypothetical protein